MLTHAATHVSEQARPSRTRSTTVLLVDDEDVVRSLVRQMLQAAGYCVLEAPAALDAIALAEDEGIDFDLVITDVVMPEMNGHELVERLRELRPEIRVLYASGYTDEAVLRKGVHKSEMAFIQKPFDRKTLVLKVRELLAEVPRAAAA